MIVIQHNVERRGRAIFARCCGVCLALFAGPALADPTASRSESTTGSTTEAPSAERAGSAAYRQALALYEAGDLPGALEQMRKSYQLSQRPELLYNIARIEGELGDCQASLSSYRRYVELVPGGRYREAAERATRELSATCSAVTDAALAAPTPEPAPQPAAPAPPPSPIQPLHPPAPSSTPYWTTSRWLGWSGIVAGTAAGLGAVYFTTRAVDARDRLQASVDRAVQGKGEADLDLLEQQRRNESRARVLTVVGGALAVSGVLILILTPRESTAPSATVSVNADVVRLQVSRRF